MQFALQGFDCTTCRAECDADGHLPPCERKGQCHLDPSPGEAELLPDNVLAVELWHTLRTGGPGAWDLWALELTPEAADLLREQLRTLSSYSAYLAREQTQD